jgi:uncharacterized protein YigA (DUF484 family)
MEPIGGLPEDLRDSIMADPALVLDDAELMRVLVSAQDAARGGNIADLRAAAMQRLETHIAELRDMHRSVIATAYDNVAGTNMIHRAVVHLSEADDAAAFGAAVAGPVAGVLRVDAARVVIEDEAGDLRDCPGFVTVEAGFVADYMGAPRRGVTLRLAPPGSAVLYDGAPVASEALLALDLGAGRGPAMLALGAADPDQFTPQQGVDLVAFLAAVSGRLLGRLLR